MSLYDVLRVPKTATKAEIERSYRSLARSYYPNHTKPSSSEFVEVNKAYSILKDVHKRSFYDMFGSVSIQLLLHNKDSYILTRMFDRVNIFLYLLTFAIGLSTFLILPFLVAGKATYNIGYTSMVSPFGIAGAISVIPMVRALLVLYGVYGIGSELKSMIFGGCEVVIVTLHVFNCTLYFDKFISSVPISLATLLALETLSLLNSLYYQLGSENLIVASKTSILVGKLARIMTFSLLLSPIPSFIKPFLCLIQLAWTLYNRRHPTIVTLCILIPPLLYAITFSLILSGFDSFLIYIPLGILITLVGLNLSYALSAVIGNIPGSLYERKQALALPYHEEMV